MKTTFTTESGSVYEIDDENKTWRQISQGEDIGPLNLRTTEGTFICRSYIEIGQRVHLIAPALADWATSRFISTSPVTSIETTV